MFLGRQIPSPMQATAATLAGFAALTLSIAGCGHAEGRTGDSSAATVTLGSQADDDVATSDPIVPTSTSNADTATTPTTDVAVIPPLTKGGQVGVTPGDESTANDNANPAPPPSPNSGKEDETRSFKVEGPENALRISYDDFDLLKVMNLDPVPKDAPERLPKWLKALDGKRIRVRGFMYPPFQDTGIRGFVLARDNQICCFGRTPKEYDLVDVFLRKGVSTNYIQNRPFDVVGVFRIKSDIEKYTAMYELEDAILIDKH